MIHLRSKEEIERLRESGRIVAAALRLAAGLCRPGIRTLDIDKEVEAFIEGEGGRPAFKGYAIGSKVFPASVCISIDDEVVHGIPGERRLESGALVGLDIGVEKTGYYADAAVTVVAGGCTPEQSDLIDKTCEALGAGINAAVAGNRVGDISSAIQRHVEAAGYSVVRDLCGHGIGRTMHESPQVPNYGRPHSGARLKSGMVLAIEPMVNVGSWRVEVEDDEWTVVTKDGSLSAHFEHTVVVTDSEAEILTICR